MTFKTMLVPVERHDQIASAFDTANLFARLFDSYVEGAPVRSLVADIYIAGAFGGVPMPQMPLDGTSPEELRGIAFEQARRVGLPPGASAGNGVRFGWRGLEPMDDISLAALARVFDVTVFARVQKEGAGPRMGPLESVLFESGRPILIAPPTAPKTIGRKVLIAWNCSTETARAVAFAMPVLERAESVTVLTVEGGTVPGPSGAELAASLKANGVKATERTAKPAGRTSGEAMLAEAATDGADLMIKGAYTQSRLRQMIFGGATSHILGALEIPVFMAH
jgi:nucleotide-binding universal stress UspA family protein